MWLNGRLASWPGKQDEGMNKRKGKAIKVKKKKKGEMEKEKANLTKNL